MIAGFVWFGWSITLSAAATTTAVSLYVDAARNHRSLPTRAPVAVLGA